MASSWVNDFDSLQASEAGGPGARPGRVVKKALSRKEKIQEELKLLEWHKLANESALKAALMQNKALKSMVPDGVPAHTVDDARWIKKVIEQEHIKPLEVSKDYVLEYERREKENQERLTAQVERHISTLKTLREKLESRAELKSKTDEYRAWQRDFSSKKQAVMVGKTLEEIEEERIAAEGGGGPASHDEAHGGSSSSAAKKAKVQAAVGNSQELSNVLESLNKLAELENRITSLERDNVYEKMISQERPKVSDRTVLDFRKARQGIEKGPTAIVYALRPKKTSWQVQVPSGRAPVGAAGAAVRAKQRGMMRGGDDQGDGGTFLTGYEGQEMDPDERRRERQRNLALAPAGQKEMRSRMQSKRARGKEQAAGGRRHDEAMKELNRRRNEQQIQKRPPRGIAAAALNRGAAAGIKSKNKHLQDFEKLKSGFKKRRGAEIFRPPPPSYSNPPPTHSILLSLPISLLPDEMQGLGNQRSARAGGGGLSAVRAVSQTAPAAGGGTGPRRLGGGVGGTTVSRIVGGGLTRRTDAPSMNRRGGAPSTAPIQGAAVMGIGGVRAIRQNRG